MLNVPLLTKTLDHIIAHPEEWYQGDWAVQDGVGTLIFESKRTQSICGSAYCFAGWALVLSGHDLVPTGNGCVLDGKKFSYMEDFSSEKISNLARDELGLTDDQARVLFDAQNTLPDLVEWVERIIAADVN